MTFMVESLIEIPSVGFGRFNTLATTVNDVFTQSTTRDRLHTAVSPLPLGLEGITVYDEIKAASEPALDLCCSVAELQPSIVICSETGLLPLIARCA